MSRNNNIIEDFWDEQLLNINKNQNKRFTDKYIVLVRECTKLGNTLWLYETTYYNNFLYKAQKNVIQYNKEFLNCSLKEKRLYDNLPIIVLREEYDKFFDKLKEFIDKKLDNLFFYLKNNKDLKIHISIDKINPKKFTYKKGSWGGGGEDNFFYNPNGLWYSCGDSFYNYFYKDTVNKYKYFKWLPLNVYSLDLNLLKIKKINNCKKFYNFNKKYKEIDIKKNYINWEKINKNLDGIEICPFITPECSGINKIIPKETKNYYISNILAKGNLTKAEKSTLWSLHWDAASGVIIKNFDKIEYKKLKL